MATYVINHPETGAPHYIDYNVVETIVDHRGKEITITDWHILHPQTQLEMGVSKPLDIMSYLFDLREVNSCDSVVDFVRNAYYFITDGCMSGGYGDKEETLRSVKGYMDSYTTYRKSYNLWTKLWPSIYTPATTTSTSYSVLLSPQGGEEGYNLRLGSVRVHREPVPNASGDISRPSCNPNWRGNKSYSAKMSASEYDFFRHLDNEFYDKDYPSTGVPMFGLELEVSTDIHPDELQYIVCDIEPKQEPFFIMKDDSSITGEKRHKYEIVTVPASPRYLKKAFSLLFKKIEDLCSKAGVHFGDVFDLSTELGNGIHIHIDRRSFHNNRQKTHIARFLSAFNLGDAQTASLFSQISRRPGDYRTGNYCSVDRSLKKYTTGFKLREAGLSGHRGCTSTRQTSTIEVRIFQGIVDINHIRSCIEATQAMLEYTHMMPLSTLNRKFASGFREFVLKSGQYNNLRKELK